MVQVASIFSPLLQQFPRSLFQELVHAEKAERHAKGFTFWVQFVAMLFCQLRRRIPCGISVMGFDVAEANSAIWGYGSHRIDPRWRMRMLIDPRRCMNG